MSSQLGAGRRQSTLAEYGAAGTGFDPAVYSRRPWAPQPAPSAATEHHDEAAAAHREPETRGLKAPQRRVPRATRPLTCRQLVQAHHVGEGVVTCNGAELASVSVVGRIVAIDAASDAPNRKAPTFAGDITDGTGVVHVVQWDPMPPGVEPHTVGSFVAVTGSPRFTGTAGRPTVSGAAEDVPDATFVTYHLLACIEATLRVVHGPAPRSGRVARGGAVEQPTGPVACVVMPRPVHQVVHHAPAPPPPAAATDVPPAADVRPTTVDAAVVAALTAAGVNPDIGLTLPALHKACRAAVTRMRRCDAASADAHVAAAVHRMAADGVVATTVDDAHFCFAA